MTGQTAVQLLMATGDAPTAKWASDLIGATEVETLRPTTNIGAQAKGERGALAANRERKALVMESELAELQTGEAFLRLAGRPVARLRLPAPEAAPTIAPAFIEAADATARIADVHAIPIPTRIEDRDDWLSAGPV